MSDTIRLSAVTLDSPDARSLAEFSGAITDRAATEARVPAARRTAERGACDGRRVEAKGA